MRVRLYTPMATFTLAPWSEHEARVDPQARASGLDAAALRRLMHEDGGLARSLRALVRELGPTRLADGPSEAELAAELARLIERGLIAVDVRPRVPAASEADERPLAPPVVAQPEPIVEDQHWIELVLVNEDDELLRGVLCELSLPDGRRLRRRTDRLGIIRVEGIAAAGLCELLLPELDAG